VSRNSRIVNGTILNMHLPLDVHEREALARKDRYGVVP
jgi:hypothetical protein